MTNIGQRLDQLKQRVRDLEARRAQARAAEQGAQEAAARLHAALLDQHQVGSVEEAHALLDRLKTQLETELDTLEAALDRAEQA